MIPLPLRLAALPASALLAGLIAPSSHREAPFVTEHPKVDATDFYMFTSYEAGREDYVTMIANYLPLQDGYGGPNYFTMDSDATYQINVDNDGDSIEDVSFVFRFLNVAKGISLPVGPPGAEKMVEVPLRNVGPITATDSSNQNELEMFSVWLVTGPVSAPTSAVQLKQVGTGKTRFPKPIDNIGPKSVPNYAAYASSFVYDLQLPGGSVGRVFVGQRKDPFVVNLGETFDLINLDPLGAVDAKESSLDDKNVTAMVLEMPKDFLRGTSSVLGGWTSATMPEIAVLKAEPTYEAPAFTTGHRQVSRLGMPLVNEVVIGLKDKDLFNASHPSGDAQFLDYVTNPTLPELIEALFGVTAPNLFPRTDLVQVFLTGIPGLNANGATSEMLRLNLDTPSTRASAQSNLGVIGGDTAGFPNGRRPGDDVVDVALRVVMGALLDTTVAPSGQLPYTDGATVGALDFPDVFPYLATPLAGAPQ